MAHSFWRRFWGGPITNQTIVPHSQSHLRQGQLGEQAAADYLRRSGFRVLLRNHREGRAELDLICRDTDTLVFVEVKTRQASSSLRPAEAVNRKKQRHLSEAALAYLRRLNNPKIRFRFDIVEVWTKEGEVTRLCHLPDAFRLSPGLRYDC